MLPTVTAPLRGGEYFNKRMLDNYSSCAQPINAEEFNQCHDACKNIIREPLLCTPPTKMMFGTMHDIMGNMGHIDGIVNHKLKELDKKHHLNLEVETVKSSLEKT